MSGSFGRFLEPRGSFLRRSFVKGTSPAWAVITVLGALFGYSVVAAGIWFIHRPRLGAEVAAGVVLLIVIEGAFRLEREAGHLADFKAQFPECEIKAEPFIFFPTDDPDLDLDDPVLIFTVRVVNRELQRSMSLVFEMALEMMVFENHPPFPFDLWGERKVTLNNRLLEPLEVGPQKVVEGVVAYAWGWDSRKSDDPPWIELGPRHRFKPTEETSRFRLTVRDHISGKSISLAVPGAWP